MDIVKTICEEVGMKLGKGFSESVYQEGIAVMLRQQCVEYCKEVTLPIHLDDIYVGNVRADIVLPKEQIIIECKAIDSELKINALPQLINYLKITGYSSGILVNFNQNPSKKIVEIINVQKSPFENTLYKVERESKESIFIDASGCLVEILQEYN